MLGPPVGGRKRVEAAQHLVALRQGLLRTREEQGIALADETVLLTWIRHRTGTTRLTVRRPDGARLELSAQRVRNLNGDQLTALATELTDALSPAPQPPAGNQSASTGQITATTQPPADH